MDTDTISKIASELASHLPFYSWRLLAIQVVIVLLSSACGAFFGGYFKRRGEHYATKSDFDSLKKQLRENTELVETIKTEISQKDWTKREWTNLRRTKLGDLLEKCNEYEGQRSRHENESIDSKTDLQHFVDADILSLTALYFPELKNEVDAYVAAVRKLLVLNSTLVVDLLNSNQDLAVRKRHFDKFASEKGALYPNLLRAKQALDTSAHALMLKIMGVEN